MSRETVKEVGALRAVGRPISGYRQIMNRETAQDVGTLRAVGPSLPGHHLHVNSEAAIEKWLKNLGFYFNPFGSTDAERDQYLSRYFFEHPDFDKLARLEDRLVFARAGDGKTVLRLRLQSLFREELPRQKVFCFSYTIPLVLAERPSPDIVTHLPHILKASVRHAFVLLAAQGTDLINLEREPALAAEFAAFFARYLETRDWMDDLREGLDQNSIQPIVQNLRSTFDDLDLPSGWLGVNNLWLQRWISLLQSADPPVLSSGDTDNWHTWQGLLDRTGFHSMLMLVDGIDVKPSRKPKEQEPAGLMRQLATPLVQALQTRQLGENIFIKLFLPIELFPQLSQSLHPTDPVTIMYWNREDLHRLLALRLQAATYGAITDFYQIVEADVHPQVDEWLFTLADSSPRLLLNAVQLVLRTHLGTSHADDLSGKISRITLANLPLHRLNLY